MYRLFWALFLLLTDVAIAAPHFRNCESGVQFHHARTPKAFEQVLQNPLYQKQLDVILAANRIDDLLVWPLVGLDTKHREALAAAIAQNKEASARRLYIELPETQAAKDVVFEATFEDRLQRARTLSAFNRNAEVLATLKDDLKSDLNSETCEAYFLAGRAERRQRHYQAAKNLLAPVIKQCDGDVKREAFFIAARLAAMTSSHDGLALLDEFLKTYPDHSYADDVQLWKISVLADIGSEKDLEHAYAELFEKYPNGDQVAEAAFKRAFASFKKGDIPGAIERLKSRLDEDRSRYWYGRLLNQEGVQALLPLAENRPHSYYGYLAKVRLAELGVKTIGKPKPDVKIQASMSLLKNEAYQEAQCLIKKSLYDEAGMFLESLRRVPMSPSDRAVLASDFKRIGRLDRTHQVMREGGLDQPWNLAFPDAYEAEIRAAAKAARIPASLLFGIAREESTFDADVISWAGAYGLCQLMPSVAREEAKNAKLKKFETSMLLDPKINARLGAQHFADALKQLKHPVLAIAAYNGGVPSVKRWKERFGSDVPLDVFVEQIPFEQTRNYVKKVMSAWLTYAFLDGALDKVQIPVADLSAPANLEPESPKSPRQKRPRRS